VDLHFDAKVITVYGDQEGAAEGYNPQKNGRKSQRPAFQPPAQRTKRRRLQAWVSQPFLSHQYLHSRVPD